MRGGSGRADAVPGAGGSQLASAWTPGPFGRGMLAVLWREPFCGAEGKGEALSVQGQACAGGRRVLDSPQSISSLFPLQDKQAVFGAVAAMMAVVLHDAQHQDDVWKQVFWLLQQYQEVQDASRVTEVRRRAASGAAVVCV